MDKIKSMNEVKSFGKINLFLDVVGLYKNRYHKIKSLFIQSEIFDLIRVTNNDTNQIRVFTNVDIAPKDNLITKTANLFITSLGRMPFGVDFYLTKNIPIGGGMGGGSSNAATILKILNSIWKARYSHQKLEKIGKLLGADIPFFIRGGVQKVGGIGDILTPLKTKKVNLQMVLVKPTVSVFTQNAYQKIDDSNLSKESYQNNKKFKWLIEGLKEGNYDKIVSNIYNKFELVIFKEYPVLEDTKAQILNSGASVSFMSGSGSTMVGIYDTLQKKEQGMTYLKEVGLTLL